jgi:RNA polymerase-binding transcription factor DksA
MNDTTQYKIRLQDELKELEKELSGLGVQSPNKLSEWDVKAPDFDIMNADENEVADRTEEIHVDSIIIDELTARFKNVASALKKMEQGKYGLCEIDAKPIEEERLQANPAARTCKEHIDLEDTLAQ